MTTVRAATLRQELQIKLLSHRVTAYRRRANQPWRRPYITRLPDSTATGGSMTCKSLVRLDLGQQDLTLGPPVLVVDALPLCHRGLSAWDTHTLMVHACLQHQQGQGRRGCRLCMSGYERPPTHCDCCLPGTWLSAGRWRYTPGCHQWSVGGGRLIREVGPSLTGT